MLMLSVMSCAAAAVFVSQVAAFQLLTGWPQEDLLDPLSGVQLAGAGSPRTQSLSVPILCNVISSGPGATFRNLACVSGKG
jgi:hypothetical protein